MEDDDVVYESGPFCPHYNDPSTCDWMCECGHSCAIHVYNGSERGCREDGCNCTDFNERD
jgi:hypothetical protein